MIKYSCDMCNKQVSTQQNLIKFEAIRKLKDNPKATWEIVREFGEICQECYEKLKIELAVHFPQVFLERETQDERDNL